MILDTNVMGNSLAQIYPSGNGTLSGSAVFNGAKWDRLPGGSLEMGA